MVKVTRFAPSPTGYLHVGHAFSALFALRAGERFLLRIEDIDPQRCRPEFTEALLTDLKWLGLDWEEPVLHQSTRFAVYQAALNRLQSEGLLYPCFCTRSDIQRAGGAPQGDHGPHYPGTCRSLPAALRAEKLARGEPHALRLDVGAAWQRVAFPLRWHDAAQGEQEVERGQLDDVVLARTGRGLMPAPTTILAPTPTLPHQEAGEGAGRRLLPASYHLCVTVDDAAQGVTLVTRGEDLFDSTPIHRLLQHLLDLPVPAYHHHPLLRDAEGKRLAKRDNAPALRDLRAAGVSPAQIITSFAHLLMT